MGKIKRVIDVIDRHLDLLDESVWDFMESVWGDKEFYFYEKDDLYTLGLFIMKLFDDDIYEFIDALASEGWHKWSHLDKWNNLRRKCVDIEFFFIHVNFVLDGFPLSNESGEFVELDYSIYSKYIDFTCSTSSICSRGSNKLEIPLIEGIASPEQIPKNLWDKLYLGVSDNSGKCVRDKHSIIITNNSDITNDYNSPNEGIFYITISEFMDLHKGVDETSKFIRTVLPRNILEKYNLPIYDGK